MHSSAAGQDVSARTNVVTTKEFLLWRDFNLPLGNGTKTLDGWNAQSVRSKDYFPDLKIFRVIEENDIREFNHVTEQRMLIGTFCTAELQKALNKNITLLKTWSVLFWDEMWTI